MTQKPKLFLGLGLFLLLLLLCLSGLALLSKREPGHQGKPLSEWAKQYGSNHWSGGNRADAEAAALAIRAIGTNAIPLLLDRMQTQDSVVKKQLRVIIPRSWHDRLRLGDRSGENRRVGAHGLAALGTNASTALPTLIELAKQHPDEDGRYIAVFAIRTLGAAAEPAIPFLIQCLTNNVDIIRGDAALGLGTIHRQPEIAVPALIRYLEFTRTSSNAFECGDAINSLAQFGTQATSAVPVLFLLLNDPTPSVRESVTNCLPSIDAEAAATANVKRAW